MDLAVFYEKILFSLLAIFSLCCILAACGSNEADSYVTLVWSVPATNTDGTSLTDLAGYEVHIGTTSRNYNRTISIAVGERALSCRDVYDSKDNLKSSRKCSYTAAGLHRGDYYFAVSAYNSLGKRSAYSNEVIKTALPGTKASSTSAF